MRGFKKKIQCVICAAIVFLCGLIGGVRRTYAKTEIREATADAETSAYLPVYHTDFEVGSVKNANYYMIELKYLNQTTGELPHTINYSKYSPYNLALLTDDEDILNLEYVTAYTTKSIILYITSAPSLEGRTGFSTANPSKIVIPEGTCLDRPSDVTDSAYAGIYFAENVILSRQGSGDVWEMADCVRVQKKIWETTVTENVAVDGDYTFSEPTKISGKTFIGWKFNGELYAVGESVKIADFLFDDGTFPLLEAVYVGYALEDGASIRYDSTLASSGIRFTALLDETDFQTYQEYIVGVGIILMPNDKIRSKEFTLQNYNGDGEAKNVYVESTAISFDSKGKFTLRAALVSVLEKNYDRAFSARAYLSVCYHGGAAAYVWETYISTRSVCQVAQLALDENAIKNTLNDTQKSILQAYVGKANSETENGEAA